MSDVDTAAALFKDGCACSQAVLGAYAARFGLDQDQALRVSAGFAAGMRMAETCGVVTGACMVLGLACCDDRCRTVEGRKAAYAAITEFAAQFKQRHGSLVCRELLGCDVTTPEGSRIMAEQGLATTRCAVFVRDGAELLERLVGA